MANCKISMIRNGGIYGEMTVQANCHDVESVMRRRMQGDDQESRVLRELGGLVLHVEGSLGTRLQRIADWLLHYDATENHDHMHAHDAACEAHQAARQVCRLLSNEEIASGRNADDPKAA